MPVEPIPTDEFLKLILGDGNGFVEFRFLPSGHQEFYERKHLLEHWENIFPGILKKNDTQNVYFGSVLRTDRIGDKEHSPLCAAIRADVDHREKEIISRNLAPLMAIGLKPSIYVDSGHGFHFWWLLEEPIPSSDAESIMKWLAEVLGSDRTIFDPPRIMRLPGTMNVKGDPVPCFVMSANPERRYPASAFGVFELPSGERRDKPKQKKEPTPEPDGFTELNEEQRPSEVPEGVKYIGGGGGRPGDDFGKRTTWDEILSPHGWTAGKKKGGVTEWTRPGKDVRAGLSATTGYCGDNLYVFSSSTQFEANAAYSKFAVYTILNHSGDFKEAAKTLAGKGYGEKRKSGHSKTTEPNFTIAKVVKFDSRPARYHVTIKHENGKDYPILCEFDTYKSYQHFRDAFRQEADKALSQVGQTQWEKMTDRDELGDRFEMREAPREATPNGALESELEDFIESAKENPEPGELKSFAGRGDGERFFTLAGFKLHLKNRGFKPTADREIIHLLREKGWMDERRRMGPNKTPRLWVLKLNGSGVNGSSQNPLYTTALLGQVRTTDQ